MESYLARRSSPKISICIPTYNAASFIGLTIKSILDSTYTDFEIIVNDDASTDHTRQVIDDLNDSRIHYFQNDRTLGPAKNWNCALRKAAGEWVGLLNHDDLIGPFWLVFGAYILEHNPHIAWVTSAYHVVDSAGSVRITCPHFPETGEYSPKTVFQRVIRYGALSPSYLLRREIFDQIGFYDEDAGPYADYALFLKLAARYPVYYSSYPHVSWRLHSQNLSHQFSFRHGFVENTRFRLQIVKKAFGDTGLPEELRRLKPWCYANELRLVIRRARALLASGDVEGAQQILDLAQDCGFQVDENDL